MLNNIIASILVSTASSAVSNTQSIEPQGTPFSHYMSVQEKPQIVLYYTPTCPYSKRVLEYLKLIHKTVKMKNLENDFEAKAELKEIGGKLQVPCLVINGKALYESEDIVKWLSEHQNLLEPQ